jgi:hypothetical protein
MPAFGQKSANCKVSTLTFECPDGFIKSVSPDATSRLFKYNEEGSIVYFFVANPKRAFSPASIMRAIGRQYSPSSNFEWKRSKSVFMMNMKTKYKSELGAWLGFDGKSVLNLKTASFVVNGKKVVFGYSWEENNIGNATAARRIFDRAEALGDHAVGCNAIATALNSITKEFEGDHQYCYLMSMPAASPK